jgi:hypothetical protein
MAFLGFIESLTKAKDSVLGLPVLEARAQYICEHLRQLP